MARRDPLRPKRRFGRETGSASTGNPGTPCDERRAIFVAAAGSDGRPHSNDETRPPNSSHPNTTGYQFRRDLAARRPSARQGAVADAVRDRGSRRGDPRPGRPRPRPAQQARTRHRQGAARPTGCTGRPGTALLLPRLLAGRREGPVFLTARRPARVAASADLCRPRRNWSPAGRTPGPPILTRGRCSPSRSAPARPGGSAPAASRSATPGPRHYITVSYRLFTFRCVLA